MKVTMSEILYGKKARTTLTFSDGTKVIGTVAYKGHSCEEDNTYVDLEVISPDKKTDQSNSSIRSSYGTYDESTGHYIDLDDTDSCYSA